MTSLLFPMCPAADAAALSSLLGKERIFFVGGKGGVGKTTIASSLALYFADRGEKTLLVSTDPAHSLSDVFERNIGDSPVLLSKNLQGLEIDAERAAQHYMTEVKQNLLNFLSPTLFSRMEKQMNLVLRAPGTVEAALTDRISSLLERNDFDKIIFDTAPTGHTLRLLSLPEIFSGWVEGLISARKRSKALAAAARSLGSETEIELESNSARDAMVRDVLFARRRRLFKAKSTLTDPRQTAYILVMIPEALPIQESLRAWKTLKGLHIEVKLLVINRVMPEAEDGFLAQRKSVEKKHIAKIERSFPRKIKKIQIPFFEKDIRGREMLRSLFSL